MESRAVSLAPQGNKAVESTIGSTTTFGAHGQVRRAVTGA